MNDVMSNHGPNLAARWTADDGYPRFQVSCECGWKTAVELSERDADNSLAEHVRDSRSGGLA